MKSQIPMFKQWTRLEAAIKLLREWNCCRGVILHSKDRSGDFPARNLAEYEGDQMIEVSSDESTGEYIEQFSIFTDPSYQQSLLEPLPPRLCLYVPALDGHSDQFHCRLKSLMEHSVRPVCIFASAADLTRIPDFLSSHFHCCEKVI